MSRILIADDHPLVRDALRSAVLYSCQAQEIHEEVAFLLEHLPPHVHVVIATRADPGFPLARLRARGELAEIRAVDLRFTPDEASGAPTSSIRTHSLRT